MGQVRLKQILKDSQWDFTSLFKITNLADGTAANDAVNLSQLNAVENTINGLEWQDSALDYIVDNTVAPPTEVSGDRYILSHDGGAPNAAYDGAAAGDIVEFDGSLWVAVTPTTGMFISADDENTLLYYWGGAAWTTKAFESTTASTGLTKVGFDIQLASSVAGIALDFTGGVLDVKYDNVNVVLNGSGELTVDDTTLTIATSQITGFNAAVSTEIFEADNFVDSTTIDFTVSAGSPVTAAVIANSIGANELNVAGNGTSGQVLTSDADGSFSWTTLDFGDISQVIAGDGLIGGGTSGSVTLDIVGNGAIDANINDIAVRVDNATIEINGSDNLQVKEASLDASHLNDTNVPTAGQVLSATTGSAGTTFTWVDAGDAPSSPARVRSSATAVPSGEGIAVTDVFGTNDPAPDTIPLVFVNGVAVFVGDVGEEGSADCWFAEVGVNATAVAFSALGGNENLVWDVVNAGYALDANDTIEVRYTV